MDWSRVGPAARKRWDLGSLPGNKKISTETSGKGRLSGDNPEIMLSEGQANRDQTVECSFLFLINLLIQFPQRPQLIVGLRV